MQVAVAKFRGELPSAKDIERLQASSPGLFSSGYFVLAAVAGSKPGDRNQAAAVVNLKGGGTAGQIMVVPVKSATTPETQALGSDLVAMSDDFAKASKTEVAVGGNGGAFGDFTSEGKAAIWPIVIAESVVILLMLIAMLRTVVLPAVAVAFDLLTAAATFGILTPPVLGSRRAPERAGLHRPDLDHRHLRLHLRRVDGLRGRAAVPDPRGVPRDR